MEKQRQVPIAAARSSSERARRPERRSAWSCSRSTPSSARPARRSSRVSGERGRRDVAATEAAAERLVERKVPRVAHAVRRPRRRARPAATSLRQGRARAESATIALVQGTSGMGKSAIVRHFLDGSAGSARRPRGTLLRARVGPLQGVRQRHRRAHAASAPAPKRRAGRADAARRRGARAALPGPRSRPRRGRRPAPRRPRATDAQQVRKRAFVALRELLVAARRPPPARRRSSTTCSGATPTAPRSSASSPRRPTPPLMLLVLAFRSEDVATNAALARDHRPGNGLPAGRDTIPIALDALSPAEAKRLATDLLGSATRTDEGLADRIASESGGSPFFVGELVRFARSTPDASAKEVRLETVLRERLARARRRCAPPAADHGGRGATHRAGDRLPRGGARGRRALVGARGPAHGVARPRTGDARRRSHRVLPRPHPRGRRRVDRRGGAPRRVTPSSRARSSSRATPTPKRSSSTRTRPA